MSCIITDEELKFYIFENGISPCSDLGTCYECPYDNGDGNYFDGTPSDWAEKDGAE